MAAFEQVMKLFHDYLSNTSCIQVVRTRWGYVRLFCEEPYFDSFEAVLCRTPQELFEELLEYALTAKEYQMAVGLQKPADQVARAVEAERRFYVEEFQKKEQGGEKR